MPETKTPEIKEAEDKILGLARQMVDIIKEADPDAVHFCLSIGRLDDKRPYIQGWTSYAPEMETGSINFFQMGGSRL